MVWNETATAPDDDASGSSCRVDATPYVPEGANLAHLRAAAAECRGCPLWEPATQVVFGEGDPGSRLMIVGETPGDREDREGRPFVGPAGRELDAALERAGLGRDELYVTNAVKHFKFEERGKRRIHQKPTRAEVKACGPWLAAEIDELSPRGILVLGATATTQLLGSKVKVTQDRGRPLESDLADVVMVTIHPSAILRADDRDAMRKNFAADVATFAACVSRPTRT
jgi:uracil-DNA glycosylase family protein